MKLQVVRCFLLVGVLVGCGSSLPPGSGRSDGSSDGAVVDMRVEGNGGVTSSGGVTSNGGLTGNNAWSMTGKLRGTRTSHTVTPLPDGRVLVAAGYGAGAYLASAELYDPGMGTWSATGSLSTAPAPTTRRPCCRVARF